MLEAIKSLFSNIRLPDFRQSQVDDVTNVYKQGRDDYLYKEGNHSMLIYAELLMGNPDVEIDVSSICRWLPPHDNEELSQDIRDRILQKFCQYLDSRKKTYEIRR